MTEYVCPKHGNIGIHTFASTFEDCEGQWCLKCMVEWYDRNILRVVPKPEPEPTSSPDRFVSVCCKGEICWCGAAAEHKVEETIFDDDPRSYRHPLISYICHKHFVQLMRPRWIS